MAAFGDFGVIEDIVLLLSVISSTLFLFLIAYIATNNIQMKSKCLNMNQSPHTIYKSPNEKKT